MEKVLGEAFQLSEKETETFVEGNELLPCMT